jgi:UDP-N-acetylmuramate--alanine ligase
MDIGKLKIVYLIGIGGIGMSALARYFNERGIRVSGYDRHPTSLTRELEAEGISIHYREDISKADLSAQLVIYTPAIPSMHAELQYFRENGYEVVKRSDVLQVITQDLFSITIAGTHGKTTISTLIAHILRHSGFGCYAFLGGISVNYQTNFWSDENPVAVIEADEYDRSFLKLTPDIAVLTAMDADHLDIYGTLESLEDAFISYTANIKKEGMLVSRMGLRRSSALKASQHIIYSLMDQKADTYATDIRIMEDGYRFNIVQQDRTILDTDLKIGGLHNVENTIAAACVAQQLGIGMEEIREAIAGFRGVKRRFEIIMRSPGKVYIDDYAHHPEELKALILGARQLFPALECTVIFQPHLYSRTRDLAEGFAHSLDLADHVLLLPVYPARELPIPGVESKLIASLMKSVKAEVVAPENALEWLRVHPVQLLITCGAGDIDQLVEPVKSIMEKIS